ncbi:hypothetical protein AKJ09_02202 [Labilithrix luteola]|uniref:Metallo-beta-lactamase domain-containing protein n=1 Tax=Labilithrix luteola TaxID=1391654 RepID=A0A0K1PPT6_9BACT|nr:MBL fold metallo-hydrolase [Labilithrix luteola]AKU95538.1 hypothetical protein AKJ09_02202 [Labilithrix luteola]
MCISSGAVVDAAPKRFAFGSVVVVALADGHFDLDAARLLLPPDQGIVEPWLARAGLGSVVRSTVNAFLIDSGDRRVLVDAGAGDLQDATLGRLESSLRAAGYEPDAIDDVLLTHLHPDHVGGVSRRGRAVFPRARVHVDAREAAFWQNESNATAVDASVRASFEGAIASLRPYAEEERLITFEPGATVVAGIRAVGLEGHTVGHTGFRLESEGETLVFCGDALHVASVQCADPAVAIRYDAAPTAACDARERLFADAAARGYWLAAAHAPFPGIGRVRRRDDGYAWEEA